MCGHLCMVTFLPHESLMCSFTLPDIFYIALHVFIWKGQVKEECTVRTHQRNPHVTFSTASLLPSALHTYHFNLWILFLIFSHQFFRHVNFTLYFPTSFWEIFEIKLGIFFPHSFKLDNKFFSVHCMKKTLYCTISNI